MSAIEIPNGLRVEASQLGSELQDALGRTASSGWYVLGPEVDAFEHEFATWLGANHVVGVNSGTDALTLALRVLDIGPGDEVIVPSNALPTAYGVAATGATVCFADARFDDYNVDPAHVSELLSPRTRAVIAVHLYGHPADVDSLRKIVGPSVEVIEDCAQAHGAQLAGTNVGTLSRLAAFSFYPTKNLGALGDGGAVVTSDGELAERLRRLRMYGEDRRYHSIEMGSNSRLDEIQAAVLRVKLRHLDARIARRREIASLYDAHLHAQDDVFVPPCLPGVGHGRHLYPVRIPAVLRDRLVLGLQEAGVPAAVHYPVGAHDQPCFRSERRGDLVVTQALANTLVSLPIHPFMDDHHAAAVCRAFITCKLAIA